MAKKTNAGGKVQKTVEVSAEDKKAIKAKLKTLKAERDAAIAGKDKKKLKEARYKIKKVNLQLKRVKVAAPAAEAPKGEAAA